MGGITRPTRLRSALPDVRMDPALGKLLRLRFRGRVRSMFRGLKTLRGALFFAIGVVVFAMWLGPSLAMVFIGAQVHGQFNPDLVRTMVPLALVALCGLTILNSAQQRAMHFTAAEIDFLFAGPFTRRELLVFKLSTSTLGTLFVSLVFSLVLLRYTNFWLAAFVGGFLTFLFVQLFSTAVVLIGQTVGEQAYTRTRRVVLLLFAALAAIGSAEVALAATRMGLVSLLVAFRHSWAGTILLAPADVFARAILAETLVPALLGWGALALVIDLGLLMVVLRLDVNYADSAIAASRKLYDRLERVRRGGALAWGAEGMARVRLPQLPRLGGAGPIARRQLIHAVRTSKGLAFILLVMAVPIAIMLTSSRQDHKIGMAMLPGMLGFATIFLIQMVPFDFRGDLDRMESLKALPLSSTAIVAGQLAVPTLVLTAIHLLIVAVWAAVVTGPLGALLVIAVVSLPFNFLLVGLENLLFLVFPARMTPTTPGDLQHMGRTIVLLAAKMLLLTICCGLAVGLAAIAYFVCGRSWIAAVSVAWLVLVAFGAILVPCVAAAYRRFDVSLDTPP